ncbi:hypothetical protein D3C60_09715 [Bacillus velezensis]|uniref:hypothetical protein n=1 Tax=Bacillus velezensis TaxID=492670 RepID=UPI000E5A28C3|nr:hypothetical protein [Bacillus velezensis]AXY38014.1 hypothetical protein D3C60_09715 [Bacillus velezensis]
MKLEKITGALKSVLMMILSHLHTLLFLVGLVFLNVTAYKYSEPIGLLTTGVLLVVVAILINPKEERK